MEINVERYRMRPGPATAWSEIDPDEPGKGFEGRDAIETQTAVDLDAFQPLQERLFAEKQQALLVVLLAIDTGGKDSTVRKVFGALNPQGCRVTGFSAPTPEERSYDFLWRIHPHVPPKGIIGIFNRSYYEDVTVPFAHGSLQREEIERRYEHIRDFEQLLLESGTSIVKFHLRISKEEQAERLRDRLEDPEKHWKFDPNDLVERGRWGIYQEAFRSALEATSTDAAPWYVVPANRKWYRDAIIARVVLEKLREMNPQFPPPVERIEHYRVE